MRANQNYERFGGVYLEAAETHVFLNPRNGPFERKSWLVHVDAERFDLLWADTGTSSLAKPKHNDEWDDEKLRGVTWQLLGGPRRPIEVPYAFNDEKGVIMGTSEHQMRLLMDWGAKTIPVMVRPQDLNKIRDAAGSEDAEPIEGGKFLGPTQEVIAAFQQGASPAKLYADKSPSAKKKANVVQEVEDYATLIHLQLEMFLLRYVLYLRNGTVASDKQKDEDVEAVQQLLCQQEVIGYWLSRSADPTDLPAWDSSDKESKQIALGFLAANAAKRQYKQPDFHLQVVASSSEAETPPRPKSDRPPPSLRVVRP